MIWMVAVIVWLMGTLLLLAWLAGDVAGNLVDKPMHPPTVRPLRASTARFRGPVRPLAFGLDDLRALAREPPAARAAAHDVRRRLRALVARGQAVHRR